MLQICSLVEAFVVIGLYLAHAGAVLAHELETFVRHRDNERRDYNPQQDPQHRLPIVRDEDNQQKRCDESEKGKDG